jgi:HAD superfamily hydrolase (TIGR01490 family)
MVLAIFDVDHTLLRADSLKLFGLFIWRRKGLRLSRLPGFIACLSMWCLLLTDAEKLKTAYVKMLCGEMCDAEASALAREFAESLLRPKIFPQALERIERHKANGHEIVLLSASLDVYLEFLAELLGADMLICTKLLRQDGFLTGDLQGANCKGREKLRRLLAQYGEKNIDWSRSYAYSDSSTDLPVLERVGTAVAVNPDRRLAHAAAERRWRTEYWE